MKVICYEGEEEEEEEVVLVMSFYYKIWLLVVGWVMFFDLKIFVIMEYGIKIIEF